MAFFWAFDDDSPGSSPTMLLIDTYSLPTFFGGTFGQILRSATVVRFFVPSAFSDRQILLPLRELLVRAIGEVMSCVRVFYPPDFTEADFIARAFSSALWGEIIYK